MKEKDIYTLILHNQTHRSYIYSKKYDWGWSLQMTSTGFQLIASQASYDQLISNSYDLEIYNASTGYSRIFKYLGHDSKYKEDHWTTGDISGKPRIELFIKHM